LSEAYRRGDTVVVNDVRSIRGSQNPSGRQDGGPADRAFIGTTLVKNGNFLQRSCQQRDAREWTTTEVALVRDVAERTWDAVERARAEASLREREQGLSSPSTHLQPVLDLGCTDQSSGLGRAGPFALRPSRRDVHEI
jgi:GAF domain-containing protein